MGIVRPSQRWSNCIMGRYWSAILSRFPRASGQVPIVINAAANGVVPCTVINLTSL